MFNTKLKNFSSSVSSTAKQTKIWLKAHPKIQGELEHCSVGFDNLILILPSVMDERHGFLPPWLYLYHEATQELDSTLALIMSGMYKESLRMLRGFMEMNLLGLYYFTTKDIDHFISWLAGQKGTLPCKQLINKLIDKNLRIKKLQQFYWGPHVYDIYRDLSQFVHTGGHEGSFQVLRESNGIQFSEKGVRYTTGKLLSVLRLLSAAWVACFPLSFRPLPMFDKFGFGGPASGFFEQDQVNGALTIFKGDKKYQKLLRKISEEDDETNNIVEEILSLPDLNEKEIQKTLTNWLKSTQDKKINKEILKNINEGKPYVAIAMVKAMQRAFIKASFPMLNMCMLGLMNKDNSGDEEK